MLSAIASIYRGLFTLLEEAGHDMDALYRGLSMPALSSRLDVALPIDVLDKLWKLVYAEYGEESGILAAQRVKLVDLREVGVFLTSTESVVDLVEQMQRYSALLSGLIEPKVRYGRNGLEMELRYKLPVAHLNERIEFTAMVVVTLLGQYLEQPIRLSKLELPREKPDQSERWERAFSTTILWGTGVARAYISHADALRIIVTRNKHVRRAFQVILNNRLRAGPKSHHLAAVRAEIVRQLPEGVPSLGSVAKALLISSRTLQRHLTQANTSFTEILSETRVGTARHYLEAGVSIKEAAFLSGYAALPAFHRAFKRETGKTPQEYMDGL